MDERIFRDIERAGSPNELFELLVEYFGAKGFAGLCYGAPQGPTAPYVLMHRGMPEEWMARYEALSLREHDPIPVTAFRLAQPVRIADLLDQLSGLSAREREFVEAFETTGMRNGVVIPAYGPHGRPGLVGLVCPTRPDAVDTLDLPLAGAVAQQAHLRMELLRASEPPPPLSPREREIVKWMSQGKSNADIAAILEITAPTVNTYVQRIYAKLQVRDRVSCVTKAMALHYV